MTFLFLEQEIHNYSGIGSLIQGNCFFKGPVFFNSRLEGSITMQTKDTLTIGEYGEVLGSIQCFSLVIQGRVEGKISCQGLVYCAPSAVVLGDIIAPTIHICPGSILDANFKIESNSSHPNH